MKKRGWVFGLVGLVVIACSGSVARNGEGVDAREGGAAGAGASDSGGKGGKNASAGGVDASVHAGAGGASAGSGAEVDLGGAGSSWAGGGGGDDGFGGDPAGDCAEPGELRCAGLCIDPNTDRRHCGACRRTCGATYACIDGDCGCAGEEVDCGGTCFDLTNDAQHCGGCTIRCGSTEICRNAACVCPEGERACAQGCTNVSKDGDHCGACGNECAIQQACSPGGCVASAGGEPGADGCVGLAGDVTLTDVWAYQSVEIPIMKSGVEVAPGARVADIVAGKDLMLRLLPRRTVSGNRLLSGRVLVQNGTVSDIYFEKKTLWSSSSPAYLDSTFQVAIPAAKVTTTTRFIAEVVDCGQPVALPSSARYSGTDGSGAALGAVQPPPLKVRIVPLRVDGRLPDTGASALEVYRATAAAMWPFAQIDLSVRSALDVADARDWPAMLDKVRARREADAPGMDVYYYGIVKPMATRAEYCMGQSSCIAGLGYLVSDSTSSQAPLRASVGLGFADRESAETMLHELGHNHGRQHAPCGVTDVATLDPAFPSYSGAIGERGWDNRRRVLLDSDTADLMGYCAPKWVGAYTYRGVLARAFAVSSVAASAFKLQSTASKWLVLLSDARGLRWGTAFTRPAPPYGQPEQATVRDAFGHELETVVVYRSPLPDVDGASLLVPEPQPGWHSLHVAGAGALSFAP